MRRLRHLLPLFLALPLAAQSPGERLPPLTLEGLAQTPAHALEEFTGRVVLLEFFAHWCVPCAQSVKHLNELQKTYGERGFSVVGVTMDKVSEAEPWIAKTKASYAYGYDRAGDLHELFSIQKTGIPFSVLVDPFGTIVWSGHPASLKEGVIERALEGASTRPTWTWPEETRSLAWPLARGELARADELARGLSGPPGEFARARVDERLAALADQLERLVTREDYGDALAFGERVAGEAKGLPLAERLRTRVAELRADPAVQRALALGERLAELERRADGVKDVEAGRVLRGEVERFVGECAGLRLEKRAQKLLAAIDRALERKSKKP